MMQCPECDRDNSDDHNFCSSCGAKLVLLCPECSVAITPDANFCGGCGHALKAAGSKAAGSQSSTTEAQRRHMTVLFCDIVGSTEMSTRMDPEDLRDLIRQFEASAEQVINRHGGFVARYMGDGILVYYGYPHAHEDDAERAVRSALDLVNNVGNDEVMLRVGIATGSVVVGDLIGSGTAKEQGVVGQAPNLAARLQSFAPPHGVIIAPETKELVGDLYQYESLGEHRIKGFDATIPVWQVAGERRGANRFDSQRSKSSGFVGREKEFDQLKSIAGQVLKGGSAIVSLMAEGGMGKSRLAHEFLDWISDHDVELIRLNCAPHAQNTALYPVSSRIEFDAGFLSSETVDQKMAKLEAMFERSGNAPPLSYTAAIVNLLFGSSDPDASDNPVHQKELNLKALEAYVYKLASNRPLLILIEDLHWCDPTTLELLSRITGMLTQHNILILGTARNEFSAPWFDIEQHSQLRLEQIEETACRAIIEGIAAERVIPERLCQQIIDKSGRNPLFVEELTKGVLVSQASIDVPDTLQDTLMERLDQLEGAREVAQVAAVIGQEFTIELLRTVAPLKGAQLRNAVDELITADVFLRVASSELEAYGFKHALLADAAYGSLLNRQRRALHADIAASLQANFTDEIERRPERLAHHLTEARDYAAAVPVWRQAGENANAKAAYSEAIDHFSSGLQHVGQLEDPTQRTLVEIELQGDLGNAIARTLGYAAPGVKTAYLRELELAQTLGPDERFAALRRIGTFYIVRANFQEALKVLEEAVAIADAEQNPSYQIDAYNGLGYAQAYVGRLAEGRESMEHALRIYDANDGHSLRYVTEQDPAISALSLVAVVTWIMGDVAQAEQYKRRLTEFSDQVGTPFDQAYAQAWAATLAAFQQDYNGAMQHSLLASQISAKYSLALWEQFALVVYTAAEHISGVKTDSVDIINAHIGGFLATGARLSGPMVYEFLARAKLRQDNAEEALTIIDTALSKGLEQQEVYMRAHQLQTRAEILQALSRDQECIDALVEAKELAASQQAKLLTLTSATALFVRRPSSDLRKQIEAIVDSMSAPDRNIEHVQRAKAVLAGAA